MSVNAPTKQDTASEKQQTGQFRLSFRENDNLE